MTTKLSFLKFKNDDDDDAATTMTTTMPTTAHATKITTTMPTVTTTTTMPTMPDVNHKTKKKDSSLWMITFTSDRCDVKYSKFANVSARRRRLENV